MSDGQPRRSDIRLPPTVSCTAVGDNKAVGDVCFYCSGWLGTEGEALASSSRGLTGEHGT
jgi:hypothetical protein